MWRRLKGKNELSGICHDFTRLCSDKVMNVNDGCLLDVQDASPGHIRVAFYNISPKLKCWKWGHFTLIFVKVPHATPDSTIYQFSKQLFVGHTSREPAHHRVWSFVVLNCLNLPSFKSYNFHPSSLRVLSSMAGFRELARDSSLLYERPSEATGLAALDRLITKVNLNLCFNPKGLTVNSENLLSLVNGCRFKRNLKWCENWQR